MLALTLTAELNGVTDLKPSDTTDSPYYYTFKVVCTSCREPNANLVGVNRHEMHEQSGSRGEANFVWKCKNCKRESTANIKAAPVAYEQAAPVKPKTIIEMDCRGLEFTEFTPDGEWEARGVESGTKFSAIDLREGEWFDYDEKAGQEVSITSITWSIKKA